ncbi:GNAT family N-acetyltransferase [Jatrophihabitans sp. DSM 45814]
MTSIDVELRRTRYDHPDSSRLIDEVQAEYVIRYGGPDSAPVDPDEFAAPRGTFVVGYVAGVPVTMGGWRRHGAEHSDTGWAGRVAEIKRMYVAPAGRGHGYARRVLTYLEEAAAAAELDWLVLETGYKQPEAIALYRSSGYVDIPPFGHYAEAELSVHLGKPVSVNAPKPPPVPPSVASVQETSTQRRP